MTVKLRYCEVELDRGFGGLKGLNKRLKESGNLKRGDEISYSKIEKDIAVKHLKPYGHCECYPLTKSIIGNGGNSLMR
jgi:hypothetical protein